MTMRSRLYHFGCAFSWLVLASLVTAGCATTRATGPAAQMPPAPHIDVAAWRARMAAGQVPIAHLHAEVRLVSFGPEGRLRGRADVYLTRPDRLRYTLLGPQGSPLIVLACDGESLRGIDMRARCFVTGSADAEQFDAWLSPVHLRLDARGWVRLLLGELDVPPQAVSAAGAPAGTVALRWTQPDGQRVWAAFGRDDARLREARLCRGEALDARVSIESRSAQGVPERLRIEHVRPGADGISQVELSLRDVDTTTAQKGDIYSLLPPQGFAIIAPQSAP